MILTHILLIANNIFSVAQVSMNIDVCVGEEVDYDDDEEEDDDVR